MGIANFYKKVGLRIKELRELKGLTQEKLAEMAGISVDYLGKIETSINNPGMIGLYKIINALGVSYSEFFSTFNKIE